MWGLDHILREISIQEVTKKDPIKAVQLYIRNLLSRRESLICGFSDFPDWTTAQGAAAVVAAAWERSKDIFT